MSESITTSELAKLFTGRAATGFNDLLTMPMFAEGRGLVREATPDLSMQELQLEVVESSPRKRHETGEKARKLVEQFLSDNGVDHFFVVLSTWKCNPIEGFRHYVSISLKPKVNEQQALGNLACLLETLPQPAIEGTRLTAGDFKR